MDTSPPTEHPLALHLTLPRGPLRGTVELERSKSLSNRALVIRSLCAEPFALTGLSNADDTRILHRLLAHESEEYDCGHGGTTLRFLTALLAFREGTQGLTGSARLCERPIGPLVEALRELGADIRYAGHEGYPPLAIGSPGHLPAPGTICTLDASVSSQFVSALLMVGPTLPAGLHLRLGGKIASEPYLQMTIQLMAHFGVEVQQHGRDLFVPPGAYRPAPLEIEADWSGAAYFLAMTALSEDSELLLPGLRPDSLQGDAVVRELVGPFGVETLWVPGGLIARHRPGPKPDFFRHDFSACPDLAQTMVALCAATGVPGWFSGLETLARKETDRTAALRTELAKFGYDFSPADPSGHTWRGMPTDGPLSTSSVVETYDDHRMAMSLSLLCWAKGEVEMLRPGVVDKSFPGFWRELKRLGMGICPI
jgi:3-phosphoshikimate 1-carboxyvinyltransferase